VGANPNRGPQVGVGGVGVCDMRSKERLGWQLRYSTCQKKYLIVQADIKHGRV